MYGLIKLQYKNNIKFQIAKYLRRFTVTVSIKYLI